MTNRLQRKGIPLVVVWEMQQGLPSASQDCVMSWQKPHSQSAGSNTQLHVRQQDGVLEHRQSSTDCCPSELHTQHAALPCAPNKTDHSFRKGTGKHLSGCMLGQQKDPSHNRLQPVQTNMPHVLYEGQFSNIQFNTSPMMSVTKLLHLTSTYKTYIRQHTT